MFASFIKQLAAGCLSWIVAATASGDSVAPGFVEGHLKIVSAKEVELIDATPAESATNSYADYPLIILSKDGKTEIAHVTPDDSGNYRVALPPGEYILDVQRRWPKGHLRASPQPFRVASNQSVRVDMNVDTGVR